MKNARYMHLLLLSSLLMMLAGCEFREVLDDYPVSGVEIKLNWAGVTEELPDGMKVIFYPKSPEGRRVERFLLAQGGEVSVPPGEYSVVIYNYNADDIKVRGTESYETIEAYTEDCKGLNTTEKMVYSPGVFYVVALDNVVVKKSDKVQMMEFKPVQMTVNFSFEVKVAGLQFIADIICNVDGMDGNYLIGKHSCHTSVAPIYVETTRNKDVIKGRFSVFRISQKSMTRANDVVMLKLQLVKTDNTVHEVKVDITKVVTLPSPQPGDNPGEAPGDNPGEVTPPKVDVTIDIPIEGDEIKVEKPEGGGEVEGGGIGGNVDDWGDPTEEELK